MPDQTTGIEVPEAGWLLGPGGQILDGPAIEENITVVPEYRLVAAEERLKEIARGREPDQVQHARDYFQGRTIVQEKTL